MKTPSISLISLLFVLGSIFVIDYASAQATTNATCVSSYTWMRNSLGESPCLVASQLSAVCSNGVWNVPALNISNSDSNTYGLPTRETQTECLCNSVVYQLYQACSVCQNGAYETWTEWTSACSQSYIGYGPVSPIGIHVPSWAYMSPLQDSFDSFNLDSAKSSTSLPESTIGANPTSVVPSPSAVTVRSSQSTTASASSASASETAATTSSKSNAPLIGGVIGGVVGPLSIGIILFVVIRQKRRPKLRYPKELPVSANAALDEEDEKPFSATASSNREILDEETVDPQTIATPYILRPSSPSGQHSGSDSYPQEKQRAIRPTPPINGTHIAISPVDRPPSPAYSTSGTQATSPPLRKGDRTTTTIMGTHSPSDASETNALSEGDLEKLAAKVVSMMSPSTSVDDPYNPPSYQPRS